MKRLLDLFCGAGGASVGYYEAGYDVVGVDIDFQPNYPFEFIQADALTVSLDGFDAIHASCPCQAYSDLRHRTGKSYPDLIAPTRERLSALDIPWIIENVEGAPLIDPVWLCGTQFPGLRVIRHRGFESNCHLQDLGDCLPHPRCYTLDKRKLHYGLLDEWTSYVMVNGGGNCTVACALDAMGIFWPMTKAEVNEAIPPAYSYVMGRQMLALS